ncbi:hypothetical protein ACHAQA_006159 [Verticillium albo-atrum]
MSEQDTMPPAGAKVALITAGSAGMGACIARVLARDLGMGVTVSYSKNKSRAEALVEELRASCKTQKAPGGTPDPAFHAIQADGGDRGEISRLVSETVARSGGRLDVVVSCMGWTRMRDFADLDDNVEEEDWDSCYSANVKAHLWLFHASLPFLKESNARERGSGVFVSMASVAGVKPSGSSLAYAVSKAAHIHLMKSLAIIAAPTVRVNSVSPGVVLTDWGLSFPAEKLTATKDANKLKEFATAEDVAEQVKTFVVSKTVTGQNAIIDAGFSL